ncbi:MAG: hypothetical protein KDG52_21020 [Rhodocyclaceae bacterium]|nr:hypothetical protein [Rhodocyclaceae bacterium]
MPLVDAPMRKDAPPSPSGLPAPVALSLAAMFHRAARRPVLWPAALQSMGRALRCEEVFGGVDRRQSWTLAEIARLVDRARRCAAEGRGACARCGGEQQRAECIALVEHLSLAVSSSPPVAVPGAVQLPELLDAMAEPAFVCDERLTMLYGNRAGRAALARRLLCADRNGRLSLGRAAHAKLRRAMHRLETAAKSRWVELEAGEILRISRVPRRTQGMPLYLVRIDPDRLACARGMSTRRLSRALAAAEFSTRQRDLAVRLLKGATLTGAAATMGISRATANGHLRALFTRSGTNRQADLRDWLARHLDA